MGKMTPDRFLKSLGRSARQVSENVPCGAPDHTEQCPVAKALKARFRRGAWQVTTLVAERTLRNNFEQYRLPGAVQQFIRKFDRGHYPRLIRGETT